MKQALYVDSVSAVVGSISEHSAISTYIESGAGVSVGGRTGLTAGNSWYFILTYYFLLATCQCRTSLCNSWSISLCRDYGHLVLFVYTGMI